MHTRDLIAEAKAMLPIHDLWHKLQWPGEPAKSCRVPYRPDDSRESGSVFNPPDGGPSVFHDFKTGETLDAIALLGRVEGLDNSVACRRFLDLSELRGKTPARRNPPLDTPQPKIEREARQKPVLPPLIEPSWADCEAIAANRGLQADAVAAAGVDGLLFVCEDWRGARCWTLTDASRWNAIFRRMDGGPFTIADDRTVKTLGIKGGWASWPVGLTLLHAHAFPAVALVEGAPDALAAYQIITENNALQSAAVICMAGAALRLPDECLPTFTDRRVRIFADADEEGRDAAARWERQLEDAGAVADSFDLQGLHQADGRLVKDLNDVCRMTAPERKALGMWEGMNA